MTDPRSNVFDMWPARVCEPNLYDTPAERARIERVIAEAEREVRKLRLRQIAEVAVMLAVAVFIGVLLATGGVL
jgi:hypothetical protein